MQEQALAFLKTQVVGVLATASLDGAVYSSVVYFSVADDFTITFITSHHSKKFQNINLNPRVSFTVGTGPAYREVTIQGTAHAVGGEAEREQMLAKIAERIPTPMREWPIFALKSLADGGTALIQITPESISFLDLTNTDQIESHEKFIYRLTP